MFFGNALERTIGRLRAMQTLPLRLVLWDGRGYDLGPAPSIRVHIKRPRALRCFLAPSLDGLGEAFVEGHIEIEGPLHEIIRSGMELAQQRVGRLRAALPRFARHSRRLDREAIEYHYNVSNEFYATFLDRDMVYSCAYFCSEADSLDLAQVQKLDHILTKLRVQPGERLLDIGCGWGALVIRAAKKYGAVAHGITLSRNQLEFARERIRAEGLQERCSVELCDYRDVPESEQFDKIASVGMFEHVGLRNLPVYFGKIHKLLRAGGLVLNHGITSSDPDDRPVGHGASEFIERYVFPHGELPHVSRATREMSAAGIEVTDIESLRRHYARTCRAWSDRLDANRDRAVVLAGERRFRIWQVYLAGCAYGFAKGWINVYQLLGCKTERGRTDALPLTRDYMYGD
ncbi:MAG: class I SAM-dependent methyltransferase [Burkholderiales bacterium]|nr:class I SAM-dependent methyltransferase [Burkholderiales bacterium]